MRSQVSKPENCPQVQGQRGKKNYFNRNCKPFGIKFIYKQQVMSNKSESGRPEENNHQKGVSKGQTEYLKKLAEGLKLNGKSRS